MRSIMKFFYFWLFCVKLWTCSSLHFQLVLLGESAVGKSSLVLRFVKGQFHEFQESTIGAAFLTQTVCLDDTTVKFEIWDTAGQERYHSLAPMYYRWAEENVNTITIWKPLHLVSYILIYNFIGVRKRRLWYTISLMPIHLQGQRPGLESFSDR